MGNKNSLKIGFIYGIQTYPPAGGGTIHGYQLVENLTNLGHELYSWYYGCSTDPRIRHFRGRDFFKFIQTIDVLYIRISWCSKHNYLSLVRSLPFIKVPVVWELNGTPAELLFKKSNTSRYKKAVKQLQNLSSQCDASIAVADGIRRFCIEDLGIKHSLTIPNGSDPSLFHPAENKFFHQNVPLEVVWIGTSKAAWHNILVVLETAKLAHEKNSNIHFNIYGDPEFISSDIPPNVTLKGSIPYLELGTHLRSANVGLLFHNTPGDDTRKDAVTLFGSPLKLFDYMSSGLSIVTDTSCSSNIDIEGLNAGLITISTPCCIFNILKKLEKNRLLCHQMGQNGRQSVIEKYNWHNVALQTEDLLKQVVNNFGN